MQSNVAVITMVRDDDYFLDKWVTYYGGLFGRDALYVVNHGGQARVTEIANGCNIISIPGDPHRNFDVKRWRLLNNLLTGLRSYFNHVIIGDVDEFVVLDPEMGNLADYLRDAKGGRVMTPFGLEMLHLTDRETDDVDQAILGPRRFVQFAPHYSKPCVVSTTTRLSRGGHFSRYEDLDIPDGLYLFHMKFCDFGLYCDTMDRRNATVTATKATMHDPRGKIMIGKHWFPRNRADDATFQAFRERPLIGGFDFTAQKAAMHNSWEPRPDTSFWNFDRPDTEEIYELPDRFFGVL